MKRMVKAMLIEADIADLAFCGWFPGHVRLLSWS